ncbi:MAG UNVERIFIED_CONTAM: hypothetical protein LVT10_18560 [Anaerolineae bacterium]
MWNAASLRGQARQCSMVIHTIGGLNADPSRGLTHHHLNYISARNVATMCTTDGAKSLLYLSASRMLWVAGSYLQAKQAAETYLTSLGIELILVRAPLVYTRSAPRSLPLTIYWGGLGVVARCQPLRLHAVGCHRAGGGADRPAGAGAQAHLLGT